MNKIATANKAVDAFLAKAQRENEPFQAFLKTDSYKKFEEIVARGIGDQLEWAADIIQQLDNSILPAEMDELTDAQIATVGHYFSQNLPQLANYVKEADLTLSLKDAFEWGVKAQYERWGVITKADIRIDFALTNSYYIAQLKAQTNYLINRSSVDQTTIEQIIKIIRDGKLDLLTNEEIAGLIAKNVEQIGAARAYVIARTEVAESMSAGQLASMKENGVPTKSWITAGANPCDICIGNEQDGEIPIDDAFTSGHYKPTAHPNDECYLEAGEIDLTSINLWGGA